MDWTGLLLTIACAAALVWGGWQGWKKPKKKG